MNKKLTEEQCKELFDIMHLHVRKAISETLNYATEHEEYDLNEVKIFIRNHFEALILLSDPLVYKIIREIIRQDIKEVTEKGANNG